MSPLFFILERKEIVSMKISKIDNVLSQRQINYINKEVEKAFVEGIDGVLNIEINNLKKQIKLILKNMHLEQVMSSSNPQKHKGWKLININPRKRALAMRGYILIFKFREFLLNEKIDYRYYYEDEFGNSHAREFSEKNIGQYVKFTSQGILINPNTAKYADVAKDYDNVMNYYFQMYTIPDKNKYMQVASDSYGRVVRSSIMNMYYHSNPGLKTKNNRYQMFNKGHIYEAIDTSISKLITDDTLITDKAIENYVFGKYLALDSIRGSQGADNPITSTSIKSGGADLYDFYTIKSQLEQIYWILTEGLKNPEEMEEIIKKNFLHKSKFEDEKAYQNIASNLVEKMINELTKNLNIN